jgi:hypothetical protein
MITKHKTTAGNTADRIEMDALLRIIEKGLGMKAGAYGAIFVPKGGQYALLFAPKETAASPATTLSDAGRALLKVLEAASAASMNQKLSVVSRNLAAGRIGQKDAEMITRALRVADSAASDAIILDGLEAPKRQRRKSA